MKPPMLEYIREKLNKLPNLNGAHYVDIIVRINGEDRRYEGDWLKILQQNVEKEEIAMSGTNAHGST